MNQLLFLIPMLPLAGAVALGLFGRKMRARSAAVIGISSVGLSFLAALAVGLPEPGHVLSQTLWTWMQVGGFHPAIALRLDSLSWVMCLVVSFVGFLIHVYSAEYMKGDEGYSRFFGYMNLFVASMLILVLASDLLLLYLGWEGVGLCSYLLIGFWYKDPLNGRAARKAFIVTRVGDTAMAIGLFVLFWRFGTLDIQSILARIPAAPPGSAALPAALLLGGALGKSAQLPLQTWLPDAMAGPTPVSALIHAATMVTAGVYLIARTHTIFTLAPEVQDAVAIIGAVTLLVAGFSALTQRDIKRILAYSTMSQIGYMFLALGVGAWTAAIFHFMTHAFFKALLFMGAGAVILALEEEHDVFKMGGLRKRLPLVFWTFLAGACSLSALPFITAGFYSKDLILSQTYTSPIGSAWLWAMGIAGAVLTSIYTFRMVFLVFFGEPTLEVTRKPGWLISIPITTLAVLAIIGGWFGVPAFLESALPGGPLRPAGWAPAVAAGAASVAGIGIAYLLYLKRPRASFGVLGKFWYAGWGFDWLYDRLLLRPYSWLARVNQADFIDDFFDAVAWIIARAHRILSLSQNGRLRWYASALVGGALLLVIRDGAIMILLLLILIPFAGGALAGIVEIAGRRNEELARRISLVALLADLALSILAPSPAPLDWLWIPQWGAHFHLEMDGLSRLLVVLTLFLGVLSVASSWKGIREKVGLFQLNLLWVLAGIIGVFLSFDLFLFYFFWELMLVPMYFLIAIWGHERRTYAAVKFFIFTQASGLLMLLAILGLYFVHGRMTGVYTFDWSALHRMARGTALGGTASLWLMLGFFVAFAVKLPVVPLHTWLPDAHTEAPTAGSVVLAGLLLKTGAYGLLRFVLPLFPVAASRFAPIAMALGVAGIIYGSILTFAQTDLKRMVAYTSVSHMGFVLLGIFAGNVIALQGAVIQILCHGLSTGALFIVVGAIQDRIGTRDIRKMGGFWSSAPRMSSWAMIFALASLGLPGLGGFVGEFLVLMGTFRVSPLLAVLAALALIFSTVYSLWLIQAVFHGKQRETAGIRDFSAREAAISGVLALALLWIGVYPQTVLNTARPSIVEVSHEYR